MAFDGITLHTIIDEMQILVGAKVNVIYEPTPNNVTISVYNGNNFLINIDTSATNYRMHLTNHNKQNPKIAPNFCMTLRKHLISSKINKIYMNGLERIVYIDFKCIDEFGDETIKTLIIEMMGKYSNIILVKKNNIIIDALKKFYNENAEKRSIMPGRKYIELVDEKNDFTKCSEEDYIRIINESNIKNLDTAIPTQFTGISKILIKSILDDLKISNTVSKKNMEETYLYLSNLLNKNRRKMLKKFEENYAITLNNGLNWEDELQVNFDLDEFYFYKTERELFTTYRNNLLKLLGATLDKLSRKMENINKRINECSAMEQNKIYGELLTANIYKYKNIEYENKKEVEVTNYYDNNKIIKIKINPSITIQKNAEKYFKRYNKMKNTLAVTEKQKEQTKKDLDYLETLIYELDNCKTIEEVDDVYNEMSENVLFMELKKKENNKGKKETSMIENYYKFEIDGYKVLVGKNNKQNDYLTIKVANDNDLWFHTKDTHGSHLILKCDGKMPKMETIIKCAEISAYFSKARYSSHVPVDYTFRKNVKKPKGAVPGYVIYTNNKTVYVEPSNEYSKVEN